MSNSDIGLIGLGVMGENLALNMRDKGFKVSLYNRPHLGKENPAKIFANANPENNAFSAYEGLEDFVSSLKSPKTVMLMIKAGKPVDDVIAQVAPLLSAKDIIIDGGNSDFLDTQLRMQKLASSGILYVGAGISGGEFGARNGPSIMAGGSQEAWPMVKNLLQGIAAKLENGETCCEWIGSGGAGHFVKMVHNGIEYADMQLIAEAYDIMKNLMNLSNSEIADTFAEWNKGKLDSYLIEITSKVMRFKDDNCNFLVDKILDSAGQKGTGKLTSFTALDESVPVTLITQAVFSRFMSAQVSKRKRAAELFPRKEAAAKLTLKSIEDALYVSKIISYAQGFSLMRTASAHYAWNLDYTSIAKIWRKGCIIRSVFLNDISKAFAEKPDLENLLFADFFKTQVQNTMASLRSTVSECALNAQPLPCMFAALSYFDSLTQARSPANLIQAQRDFFGAHTYERIDSPRGEFFHTNWESGKCKQQ